MSPRMEELLEQFRRDLADIQARHDAAIRETLERIRQRRLAELRSEITPDK